MRQALALIVALIAALTASLAHADPADIAATARGVVRVVLINNEDGEPSLVGHGSGIAVAPDVILTNAHVVEAAQQDGTIRIGVVPPQGKGGWFGRVIAFAPKSDLALVKLIERGSLPPATLFTGGVGDGTDVVAVGYPGNVDMAQGLNVGDIVSPTSPVKTRGTVSSGRSSKSFETILHTAPIGSGNSGGPLLDPCGRVVGINSFGTLSNEGDSEFYFAVSGAEVIRFLRAAQITPRITGVACRSLAELDRAEADRAAGEKVHSEEEARALAARKHEAMENAERGALYQVLAERELRGSLAMVALILALGAAGGAFAFADKRRKVAAGAGVLLVLASGAAWLTRPGFGEIDTRARRMAEGGAASPGSKAAGKGNAGSLICSIDLSRSRITVSDGDDVAFAWGKNGCANGKEPFGLASDGWSRISLSETDDGATVAHFDPATGSYRADRYFLDLDTMTKLRTEIAGQPAPSCGSEDAARKLGAVQASLLSLLPGAPNERLVYNCASAAVPE